MENFDRLTKSYEKINYSIRPAKCIERKMLCDAFRRLSPFGGVKKYRYIGFGSPFFADFYLFHKMLEIENMISIEKNEEDKERFKFNAPFSCIKMIYGDSNDVLPSLKWDVRTILWLDYDFTLKDSILKDIRYALSSMCEGSVIIVTVDGNIKNEYGDKIEKREKLKQLSCNIGEEKVPRDIKESDLNGWKCAKAFCRIITNEIQDTVKDMNGVHSKGNQHLYQQLFNFHYSDGTKMLTVGGVIFDERNIKKFQRCSFEKLNFIRFDQKPCRIKIPKLTLKEIKHLDTFLPDNFNESPEFIPFDQKEMYQYIYKYFPHYTEVFI